MKNSESTMNKIKQALQAIQTDEDCVLQLDKPVLAQRYAINNSKLFGKLVKTKIIGDKFLKIKCVGVIEELECEVEVSIGAIPKADYVLAKKLISKLAYKNTYAKVYIKDVAEFRRYCELINPKCLFAITRGPSYRTDEWKVKRV